MSYSSDSSGVNEPLHVLHSDDSDVLVLFDGDDDTNTGTEEFHPDVFLQSSGASAETRHQKAHV